LRALPFEWAAAHRAGLGRFLARLPDAWTQWATPSLATVDRALSSGGCFSVDAGRRIDHYLEAIAVRSGTRYNFFRGSGRADGSYL